MVDVLGLIGCGLIGGSFALALKRAGLVRRVVGYSNCHSMAEKARQLGVIDVCSSSILQSISGADLVLVAVPVAASESVFAAMQHGLGSQTLLMDVGSTKGSVVDAAQRTLLRLENFVPAHPIAGKEASGPEHADPDLFLNRQVVLTPVAASSVRQVERAASLWKALGAHVSTMGVADHDASMAVVSHLPHLLAFAAVSAIKAQPGGLDLLKLAGAEFADFSRIAASSPEMWRDIFLCNREQILLQSQIFRRALMELENHVAAGDGMALSQSIENASRARFRSAGLPPRNDRSP
ncbi:prephenate dehydrogenase/arogenate dehydrogenase family protein [Variovorax sp. WS11]|uniref:prephenate dehydrogenase n=1 Tax=Variovorax sp. WS11 TaxID=1105204 RepID=UPI000D0C9BA3|nr:prephenate dehydrogenase/arogenate dehydrogenase family protein [Variovorax sp. WS11]NDZ18870.1 prephenate dehydrogenase/arogenate dehydrogenase family protein [Variovorax sp. WS11]PSL79082.1 prephenate dehydrogenase/arogenate dehydrogenase family protein [Variovorax sp. WS11]